MSAAADTDVPIREASAAADVYVLICRITIVFGHVGTPFANLLINKFANHQKCNEMYACTVSPDCSGNGLM